MSTELLDAHGRPKTLSEHLYISHEGTLPPQWEEADRLAG